MGGDLRQAPAGKVPTFLVAALKELIGANLDRIQIIKGWLDAKGELQEKVYDVVWSDGRKLGTDGKLPPVGNTVDVANATWTNTISAPEMMASRSCSSVSSTVAIEKPHRKEFIQNTNRTRRAKTSTKRLSEK
jgi:hypothetical protein